MNSENRDPKPKNHTPDFFQVKLSTKGEAVAQGCLRICGGKYEFCFKPGIIVQVTRGEWAEILSKETRDGAALLEICTTEDAKDAEEKKVDPPRAPRALR